MSEEWPRFPPQQREVIRETLWKVVTGLRASGARLGMVLSVLEGVSRDLSRELDVEQNKRALSREQENQS